MEKKCSRCNFVGGPKFFKAIDSGRPVTMCLKCRKTKQKSAKKAGKTNGLGRGSNNRIQHFIVDDVECKECIRCEKMLALDQYSKDNRKVDGLYAICKPCGKKEYKEMGEAKKAERLAQIKEYASQNKEKIAKRTRIWRDINRDILNEKTRTRIANNPHLRIARNLRGRLTTAIKAKDGNKCDVFCNLLGITPKELKKYLEDQFEEGMTWENYNIDTWHIDHIRPLSSFDLAKEKDQRICFHYTNLQPLWAAENLAKSDDWFPEDHIFYKETAIWERNEDVELYWES